MKLKQLLWAALMLVVSAVAWAEPLTVGITPLKPASKLAEEWGPLLDEVGRRAGVQLAFRTAQSIPAFGERLAQGEYDLAYINPYQYKLYSEKPGYRAFAREKGRPLEGIIIVRKDSPYRQLKDLEGATLIFPTPLAFAASILTQAELQSKGINIKARYVQSHDSVFRGVATGGFDGGGTIMKVFQTTDPELAKNLRVLEKTASYQPHPFAAHPRVPVAVMEQVRRAFLSLERDEAGRKLLEGVAFKGFEAAADKDYNDVRALKMEKLIEAVN
jgi:phosphonate transport system substrate-binding protein